MWMKLLLDQRVLTIAGVLSVVGFIYFQNNRIDNLKSDLKVANENYLQVSLNIATILEVQKTQQRLEDELKDEQNRLSSWVSGQDSKVGSLLGKISDIKSYTPEKKVTYQTELQSIVIDSFSCLSAATGAATPCDQ